MGPEGLRLTPAGIDRNCAMLGSQLPGGSLPTRSQTGNAQSNGTHNMEHELETSSRIPMASLTIVVGIGYQFEVSDSRLPRSSVPQFRDPKVVSNRVWTPHGGNHLNPQLPNCPEMEIGCQKIQYYSHRLVLRPPTPLISNLPMASSSDV